MDHYHTNKTQSIQPIDKITWINRVNGILYYAYLTTLYHLSQSSWVSSVGQQ